MIETALRHALTGPCVRMPLDGSMLSKSALVKSPAGAVRLHRGSTATTNRPRNLLPPEIEPTPWGHMADAGFVYTPLRQRAKISVTMGNLP